MRRLRFTTLRPADLLAIERDKGAETVLGIQHLTTREEAEAVADEAVAWAVREDDRLIACFGIVETFEGTQGWGWAVLAPRIGMAHFELTRFVQGQVAGSGLARLELLAKGPDLEPAIAAAGDPDQAEIMRLAWRQSTPQMRWAVLLGLKPAHVLRQFGAARETYLLFERIDPAAKALREAA